MTCERHKIKNISEIPIAGNNLLAMSQVFHTEYFGEHIPILCLNSMVSFITKTVSIFILSRFVAFFLAINPSIENFRTIKLTLCI